MSTPQELDYAALICEAAVGCNMLNAAMRQLKNEQTKDKKLQPQIADLHRLSEAVLPRMLRQAGAADADFLNSVANAVTRLGQVLLRLDGAGMARVLAYAEGQGLGEAGAPPQAA